MDVDSLNTNERQQNEKKTNKLLFSHFFCTQGTTHLIFCIFKNMEKFETFFLTTSILYVANIYKCMQMVLHKVWFFFIFKSTPFANIKTYICLLSCRAVSCIAHISVWTQKKSLILQNEFFIDNFLSILRNFKISLNKIRECLLLINVMIFTFSLSKVIRNKLKNILCICISVKSLSFRIKDQFKLTHVIFEKYVLIYFFCQKLKSLRNYANLKFYSYFLSIWFFIVRFSKL